MNAQPILPTWLFFAVAIGAVMLLLLVVTAVVAVLGSKSRGSAGSRGGAVVAVVVAVVVMLMLGLSAMAVLGVLFFAASSATPVYVESMPPVMVETAPGQPQLIEIEEVPAANQAPVEQTPAEAEATAGGG